MGILSTEPPTSRWSSSASSLPAAGRWTPPTTSEGMPSDARRVALDVLRRTFEQGAYTDRAFQAAARDLGQRDRALAMRLAYGAVQRRATLDHLIERCAERPVAKLDPLVRGALRLGAYELCFTQDAEHAAVNET